ncbi:MAG: hypothetical protein AAB176_12960 [Pseudomonadota bacterium]
MQITNSHRMPTSANQRLGQEIKELKQGRKASEFRLNVTGGKITSDELQRMLSAARRSKSYQSNSEKFQFKLIEHKAGRQVLTFKEQGWFSKLKGVFNIGTADREAQRAAAADLISKTFRREQLALGMDETWLSDAMTHAEAISFQATVMTDSELAPLNKSARAQSGDAPETPTMQDLMGGDLAQDEALSENNRPSFSAYDPQEDTRRAATHEPLGSPKSSFINPIHQHQPPQFEADPWEMNNPFSFRQNDNLMTPPVGRSSFGSSFRSNDSREDNFMVLLLNPR